MIFFGEFVIIFIFEEISTTIIYIVMYVHENYERVRLFLNQSIYFKTHFREQFLP